MFASKDDHEQVEEVKILEAKLISQLCSAIGGSSSSEDVEGYLTALKSIHGETLLTKGGKFSFHPNRCVFPNIPQR